MELSADQQIIETLSKAKKVLIALPQYLTADCVASGLALALFLKKMEKDVEVASSGKLPENLKFLPAANLLKSELAASKSLVVVVDTSVKKLDEISYQSTDNKVEIYLKAKEDMLTAQDISFNSEKFPVDAIVALESKSLGDLGTLFEQNTDLFFETPKINIDNHPGNEYFGAINLVDVTASSVAEILSGLFEKFENQLVDEDIATCLLTGIITKTNSFQHVHTTPKAFLKASELIALGGRQQEVVKNIYKTKSLPFLRLWGRCLARLKMPDSLPAVYSLLNMNDFAKAGAEPKDLPGVLKELVSNISHYKVVAVISELAEKEVKFLASAHIQVDAEKFLRQMGGNGKVLENGSNGQFKILDISFSDVSLADAEQKFLEAVKLVAGSM
jgi:nanoRNase/pAp phosphatase (c-di-AMP/oligoRNAs hydrolase)